MALSDTWLKSILSKDHDKAFEKADRDGLSVRVSPKGKITFQIRYRYVGKASRVDLGSYPSLGLKDARIECARLRAELEKGYNPKVVKVTEKNAIITAITVSKLFYDWYESYCVENKVGHFEVKRSFELHILPKIGKIPVDQILLKTWLEIIENKSKKTPAIAHRLLTNAKQMLKWGAKRRMIRENVLNDISPRADLNINKNVGSRSFNDNEIKLFLLALNHSRIAHKNKLFLKLCLVLGCRNGELRLAKKSDFDMVKMVWTVPPENHKTGKTTNKPIVRPIIPQIVHFIEEAMLLSDSDYLFNNAGTNEPMGRSAPLSLPYNINQWLRKNMDFDMPHWSVHDLRKTARTNLSTLTEPHIAEIILGHKLPGQWQVYDHHAYLSEQGVAYSAWFDRLTTIVND